MADQTTAEDAAAAPGGINVTMSSAVAWWRLDGPPGEFVDACVALLIGAGAQAEMIQPGTAYRFRGGSHPQLLSDFAPEVGKVPGCALAYEQPPLDRIDISSRLTPAPRYPRVMYAHGHAAVTARFVARAVDRGLFVSAAGVHRWSITGPTSSLMAWMAESNGWPIAEALMLHGLTAEQAAAEDTGAPPVNVTINLPPRRTTSDITRDPRTGDITQIVQLERDA